jgi:phosphoribosylamine--glycine ligase
MNPGAVAALATELGIDLVVVGPEAPLVAGVAGKAANQASKNRATFGRSARFETPDFALAS